MKIEELKNKLNLSVIAYKNNLSEIRTGIASPALVENIKVEAYAGTFLTVKELATINVIDSTLLTVNPWDTAVIKSIEKAIRLAGIGLNPVVDQNTIKIPVPQLNEEQRKNYVKIAKEKLEESKISVRNIRQDAMKSVDEQKENGVISEDELKQSKSEIEEEIKKTNAVLEELFKNKEKELLTI